ncbi:MAG: hypothetical protein ACJAQZ_004878, partial [Planctomycetota bacterium]
MRKPVFALILILCSSAAVWILVSGRFGGKQPALAHPDFRAAGLTSVIPESAGGGAIVREPAGMDPDGRGVRGELVAIEQEAPVVVDGMVLDQTGSRFSAGRIALNALRGSANASSDLADSGEFSWQLDREDWPDGVATMTIIDSHGHLIKSGIIRLQRGLTICVVSRGDASWRVQGTLRFDEHIQEPSGWAAIYSIESTHQPLAEARFSGNPARISLTCNLSGDWLVEGGVELRILDEMFNTQASATFESMAHARDVLAKGWHVPVDRCDVAIGRLPSGDRIGALSLGERGKRLARPVEVPPDTQKLSFWMGRGKFVVFAKSSNGEVSAYGNLIRDGAQGIQMGSISWQFSLPGNARQKIFITDAHGNIAPNVRLTYILRTGASETDKMISGAAISDATGEILMEDMLAGAYTFRCARPLVDGGGRTFNLQIPSPPARLRVGAVAKSWIAPTSQAFELIGQYTVYLKREGASRWFARKMDGRFGPAAIDLEPAKYEVYVYSKPLLGNAFIHVKEGESRQDFLIPVDLPAMIWGAVVSEGGAPVVGRSVRLAGRAEESPVFDWLETLTDVKGEFALCPVGIDAQRILVMNRAG